MQWFRHLDVSVFRFINDLAFRNRFLDDMMRFCAGNKYFAPLLIAVAILVIWKGGVRGRVCLFVSLALLAVGDPLIWNTIKHATNRARPFITLSNVRLPLKNNAGAAVRPIYGEEGVANSPGKRNYNSMPSSHAANWFIATTVLFIYYRRSIFFMLPGALIICFSRVYCGVHFPSDVLFGAILGAGYGIAGLLALNFLWQLVGRKLFPLWHEQLPSLANPGLKILDRSAIGDRQTAIESYWFRLGCVVIATLFVARLLYIASGIIELNQDEAYYWLWSKHPALSYFSKPPLIAFTHLIGTALWGDNAIGVRFFSPVIAALISFLLLRFLARNGHARAGFWLVLTVTATPMLAGGAILMTIDPLSVLFWTAAMLAGWRAIQENSNARDWLCVGLFMGLGFLSKYTGFFQLLSFAVFFALWPPARKQLKRAGPWLAILVVLLCSLPVLIWNQQHGWVTVAHVANDGKAGEIWKPAALQFLAEEAAVLNPFFFLAMIWAAIAIWRRGRKDSLKIYFFAMGAPLFLCYLLYSFHSRVQPNWIAPAVIPLFCLMTIYWSEKIKSGVGWPKIVFAAALIIGFLSVTILHDTDLAVKLFKRSIPIDSDPLQRVRGWKETARIVGESRDNLIASEKKQVFIIANHYGTASEATFYMAAAKKNPRDNPLVYCRPSEIPVNQFYFWQSYKNRKGQNAIFFREMGDHTASKPLPKDLVSQFKTINELGVFEARYGNHVMRKIQIFVCRELK